LLVEDDRYLLEGLRELLEVFEGKYALHVLTATNGNEGLRLLAAHQPDLIISDVMMPEMDGYAFLREVRKQAAWLQIPVIFLTARSEPKEIHRGLLSGVEEYIPKPYDIDELINLVQTQLDRHFAVQSAVQQSFEELKRSILRLLRPDFIAPLETVSRHSRMLEQSLQGVTTDQDLRSSLYHIRQASRNLASLVEDLIALAEFKTGEAELSFAYRAEYVSGKSLSVYFRKLAAVLEEVVDQAGVSFDYDVAASLPPIRCDRHSLKQSIGRMVRVAIGFCEAGGGNRVVFSVFAEPGTLVLTIRMPGSPLPEDLVYYLQDFCQKREMTTLELPDSSSGPSLMVAKGVLDLHGATLLIDNEAEGARMLVRMPAQLEETFRPRAAGILPA
jgi:DNA-binding response OmpR family regulator